MVTKGEVLYSFQCEVQSHLSKKNGRDILLNRKTGRRFPGKSRRLIKAEELLILEMKSQANTQGLTAPLTRRLWLEARFYFPNNEYYNKDGSINRNLPDLSNLYELPQDCLQSAGVIKNDTQIDSHDLSRRLPGGEYRLELYLREHVEDGKT